MTVPRVVLIGGAGFIGSALARELAASGAPPVIADLRTPPGAAAAAFPHHLVDVTRPESLSAALAGGDTVVHLAAEHRDDVEPAGRYFTVNVEGTRNLLAACTAAGVRRFIFISSVAVYSRSDSPQDETAPPAPFTDYGRSKLAAEELVRRWQAAASRRRATIVRPVAVYGPGGGGNIQTLITQIAAGRFRMVGAGRQVKSLAYVDNLAAFLAWLLAREQDAGLYNYADAPDLPVAAVVAAIRQALGQPATIGRCWPAWLGLSAAWLLELVAALRGRPSTVTVERVRRFLAATPFAAARAREEGFVQPVAFEAGLRLTVRALQPSPAE